MENSHTPHETLENKVLGWLDTLFAVVRGRHGIPDSAISSIVANDRAFFSRIKSKKSGITVSTFDVVAGRFRKIWPEDVAWPVGVPNVPEVDLMEFGQVEFQTRMEKAKEKVDG
ncbi:hypothetical protein [Marivivens aquimaris]|uniref:hypothetical protein n=1 Tax=Marivivens aquimaris TaxID=2774876 RepID=UPI00187DF6E1|nr:hypothetical protein [Marivivens aquimaris]